MDQLQLLELLVAMTVLLAAAHLGGLAATRLRQPRVAGEIVGGLILGPTVLGVVAPAVQRTLFPSSGPVAAALSGGEQLGLLMLMFLAGSETGRLARRDLRLIGSIVVAGLLIPFAVGLALTYQLDLDRFAGPAHSAGALALVIASAIAVTSIPVISRIMLDIGIIRTSFAGVVLSAAVMEDVVLYTVVAVALGLARAPGEHAAGLPSLLGLDSGTLATGAYYGVTVLVMFGCALRFRPRIGRILASRWPGDGESSSASAATRCVLLVLGGGAAAALLGIQPMFGAFLAGVVMAGAGGGNAGSPYSSCRSFSTAFFLPLYFGSVGLKLDLVHHFDAALTAGVVVLACLVKLASVYAGARMGGEPAWPAVHLAVALNCRGGPGIALATLALSAGVVDQTLYTALIILPVGTSLMAGGWLRAVVKRGMPLRGTQPEPAHFNGRSPSPPDAGSDRRATPAA